MPASGAVPLPLGVLGEGLRQQMWSAPALTALFLIAARSAVRIKSRRDAIRGVPGAAAALGCSLAQGNALGNQLIPISARDLDGRAIGIVLSGIPARCTGLLNGVPSDSVRFALPRN